MVERSLDLGWELGKRHHVGDGQAAARLEHAVRLAQHRPLVGREVDHAVRDDHVDARRGKGKRFDRPLEERRVAHARARLVRARDGEHLIGHVHAVRVTGRPDTSRREEHIQTRSAPEVEDGLAGAELGEERGVATPEAGRRVDPDGSELLGGIRRAAAVVFAARATRRVDGHAKLGAVVVERPIRGPAADTLGGHEARELGAGRGTGPVRRDHRP